MIKYVKGFFIGLIIPIGVLGLLEALTNAGEYLERFW